MIYALLTLIVTGVTAWPYYYRFKSFDMFSKVSAIPFSILQGFVVAAGVVLAVLYVQKMGSADHIFRYDFATGITFVLLSLVFIVWNAYLIFTSETVRDNNEVDSFEGVIFCAAVILGISVSLGLSMAYAIISLVSAV